MQFSNERTLPMYLSGSLLRLSLMMIVAMPIAAMGAISRPGMTEQPFVIASHPESAQTPTMTGLQNEGAIAGLSGEAARAESE
jgi:hypothetical protein